MDNITRTPLLGSLLSAMLRGANYDWLEFTTLNEKFNVLPKQYPPAGTYPKLCAIAIGWGAMDMEIGADGEKTPFIRQHAATDFACFRHLPYVLRRQNEDLTAAQRERYFMRVAVNYHGEDYWAYYLKRQDFTQDPVKLYIKKTVDGQVIVEEYIPSNANLNPVPVDLTEAGANLLRGQSVLSSTIVELPFDDFDINEIVKAAKIIKQATGKAIISEIGLVTGGMQNIDIPVAGGGTVRFTEIIGAQLATHISTNYGLDFINRSLREQIELGISEPLFKFEGDNS